MLRHANKGIFYKNKEIVKSIDRLRNHDLSVTHDSNLVRTSRNLRACILLCHFFFFDFKYDNCFFRAFFNRPVFSNKKGTCCLVCKNLTGCPDKSNKSSQLQIPTRNREFPENLPITGKIQIKSKQSDSKKILGNLGKKS